LLLGCCWGFGVFGCCVGLAGTTSGNPPAVRPDGRTARTFLVQAGGAQTRPCGPQTVRAEGPRLPFGSLRRWLKVPGSCACQSAGVSYRRERWSGLALSSAVDGLPGSQRLYAIVRFRPILDVHIGTLNAVLRANCDRGGWVAPNNLRKTMVLLTANR